MVRDITLTKTMLGHYFLVESALRHAFAILLLLRKFLPMMEVARQ